MPVKALCSNQRSASEPRGTKEFWVEFFMRTNGAVAFCEQHSRSLPVSTSAPTREKYSKGVQKWLSMYSANWIPLRRNAEIAPEEVCVCVCLRGGGGCVSLELLFAPLSVAELIRLLPQQLPLCAAPRIHFCGNSMPLIKTVAIALVWEWLSQKIHSPPNYKGNFMSWKTESNYFNKHKAFSIEPQSRLI